MGLALFFYLMSGSPTDIVDERAPDYGKAGWRYLTIVDAGSSGCRAHVFRWRPAPHGVDAVQSAGVREVASYALGCSGAGGPRCADGCGSCCKAMTLESTRSRSSVLWSNGERPIRATRRWLR